MMTEDAAKPLTGLKVFLMFAAGFGIIIAVNVFLAVKAVKTFPGLVVDNSYIASQSFDREREAQIALGWEVDVAIEHGQVIFSVLDANDQPVAIATPVEANFGRVTHVRDDQLLTFTQNGTRWSAPAELSYGRWLLRLELTGPNGEEFRQNREVFVSRDAER